MPTVLGPPYRNYVSEVPPRISPIDFDVYSRWIKTTAPKPANVYYDVGLGEGAAVPPGIAPALKKMWLKNTQCRVDVLIETDTHIHITELRDDANPNAVGRLLVHKMLWEDDPAIKKPIKMHLVTNNYYNELARLCKLHDIIYEVV